MKANQTHEFICYDGMSMTTRGFIETTNLGTAYTSRNKLRNRHKSPPCGLYERDVGSYLSNLPAQFAARSFLLKIAVAPKFYCCTTALRSAQTFVTTEAMKYYVVVLAALSAATTVMSHPEKVSPSMIKREVEVATGKCAKAIEARKAKMIEERSARLFQRRIASGNMQLDRSDLMSKSMHKSNELKYSTIQNDTCVLAPETVWGPYA